MSIHQIFYTKVEKTDKRENYWYPGSTENKLGCGVLESFRNFKQQERLPDLSCVGPVL